MKTTNRILLAFALVLSAVAAIAQPSTRIDLTQLAPPADTSVVNYIFTEGDTAYYSPFFDTLKFSPAATTEVTAGMLGWNADDATLNVGINDNVTLQVGQEMLYYVKNQTGGNISNGQVVQFNGTVGASGRLLISLARADTTSESKYVMGIATEDIANGEDGFVTAFGKVRGIDTDGSTCSETWADGDILYLSATTAGCLTSTEPSAPNLKIPIAAVVNAANNGTLFVRPTFYPRIEDIHNVDVSGATDGQVLTYVASTGTWEPGSAGGGSSLWLNGATPGEIYYNIGNVGIGTDNPAALLDVSGGNINLYSSSNPTFTIFSDDGAGTSFLELSDVSNNYAFLRKTSASAFSDGFFDFDVLPGSNTLDSRFRFFRNSDAATATIEIYRGNNTSTQVAQLGYGLPNYVVLNSTDNFGVGVLAPSQKLHVAGIARFEEQILLDPFASQPTDSIKGELFFDDVDDRFSGYDGTQYRDIAWVDDVTGGGTGWLKDSLAVADVDIAMNRNQLSFSSDIPFTTATDTLISISTPRSDASLKPHFLVFNFGSLSAGFVEQDQNFQFFNTTTGEGLSYAGDYFNATATSSLKNRQIPDIQTVKRLISDSVGTSINIYNTSDTVLTDRKVIAQDQNTYLDFLGFDYLNIDNDDGNDNIGLRINGAATAGFENRLLVLSDGKGQDSILFRHEHRGGTGGFGMVSTIATDFSAPGFTLTSGSNRLNLATNEYTDGTNSKGLEYSADYSSNFTNESLVTKRYVDAQVISGNGYWKDSLTIVRTTNSSAGLDFVFGSTQLDDTGDSTEDDRFGFDNSKGAFFAGRFQGTQVDNANRGVASANFGLNNIASGNASVVAGGQNNTASGTGAYVHGENALASLRNQYAQGVGAGTANSGAAQYMRLVGYRDFTGTGTAKIYVDGSSQHFAIPNNTLWNGTAYCNVVVTTAGGTVGVGDRVFLRAQFSAKNEAGIVDVLANYDNPGLNDALMGAVSLLLGADNTNDALNVNIASIPGISTSEVRCACYFDIMQTKF
jgi:hypothetical protein